MLDPKNGDPYSGYGFVTRTTTTRPTAVLVETRRMRAPDTTRWIVGLPEQVLLTSGSTDLAKTTLGYSNEGRVTQLTGYEGPRGNLASAIPRIATRTYDSYGNIRSVTDPASRTTEVCYDGDSSFPSGPSCGSPTSETTHGIAVALRDPLEQVTTFQPDPVSGEITETFRMYSGDRDKTEFDAFGRVERSLFRPAGGSDIVLSETDYFGLNEDPAAVQEHAVTRARVLAGSTAAVRTASYLDGFGNPVRRVQDAPLQGGQARYLGVATQRNPAALQVTSTYPATCGANQHCSGLFSGSQPRTVETRDALNRVTRIETPDGVSQLHYRSITKTHPDVGPQSFDVVLQMDPRGNLTQRIFDGERVVWVEECTNAPISSPATADLSGASCQSPAVTFYRHAPTGELAEIHDALTSSPYGNPATATLRYVYDSFGRITTAHDVNKTAPTLTAYNAAGNVEQTTNARGQVVLFTYDDLDRPETTSYPIGGGITQEYSIVYDTRTRDPNQIRQKNISAGGAVTIFTQGFDYDLLGRLSRSELQYGANATLITESELDLRGRTTRIRYPDLNTEVAYEYEGAYLKRVCELAGASSCSGTGAIPYISNVEYDGIGREIGVAGFTSSEVFPPVMSFTYNPNTYVLDRLKVSNMFEGVSSETLDLSYLYDRAGNVTTVTDNSIVFDGSADIAQGALYSYDKRNRLASWTRSGQTTYFNYNEIGNLVGKEVSSPNAPDNQIYDSQRRHRLLQGGGVSYSYDADGNVTQRGAQQLAYDPLHRIRCIGPSGSCQPFTYGVDGVRLAARGTLAGERAALAGVLRARELSLRAADLLKPGGRLIGEAGTSRSIRVVRGGVDEAQDLFGQLSAGGRVVEGANFPGTLVELPGVGRIGLSRCRQADHRRSMSSLKGLGSAK
jgi:YD repeat-containing protein